MIPGLPLRYYRKILYATTEFNSREMEIGAEVRGFRKVRSFSSLTGRACVQVICGAFLACAVTYSDDSVWLVDLLKQNGELTLTNAHSSSRD